MKFVKIRLLFLIIIFFLSSCEDRKADQNFGSLLIVFNSNFSDTSISPSDRLINSKSIATLEFATITVGSNSPVSINLNDTLSGNSYTSTNLPSGPTQVTVQLFSPNSLGSNEVRFSQTKTVTIQSGVTVSTQFNDWDPVNVYLYDSFEGDVDIWYSSASPANFVTTTSQARHGTRSVKAVISNTATNWNFLGVDDNVVVLPSTSAHFITFVYYYKTICTSSSANPEFGFYLKQNNGNYLTIQESKLGTTNGWVRQQVNFSPNSFSQIIGFEFSFNDFDASIPSGTTCECYIDNVQVY
jgi:hypothetical protein